MTIAEPETLEFTSEVRADLLDVMGGDDSIIKAMLVSTQGSESLDASATPGRINFLMSNRHGTPFEHNALTFFVAAPIFVFREFHRHRIGFSYNEMSGRYTQLPALFYIPDRNRPLVQTGKPGNYIFIAEEDEEKFQDTIDDLTDAYEHAYRAYEAIMARGHAKEIARACLPVAIFSEMYVTCNARSLMSFLSLRTKAAAKTFSYDASEGAYYRAQDDVEHSMFPSFPMHEIEMVARKMEAAFAEHFPLTYASFNQNGRVSP
jgi:thymidylate synthase (FAD)